MTYETYTCIVDYITVVGAFGYDPVSPPEGQNIVTTTRSHSNRTVVDAVEACDPSEILRAGGAGHKVKPITATKFC